MNIRDLLKTKQKKEYTGSRVESIVKQNANYKTQKLEMKPFNITNPVIKNVLDQSDFGKIRKKLSKELILKGLAALVAVPHNGTFYITILKDIEYSALGKTELWVQGSTHGTFIEDNQAYEINVRVYYNEAGKATIDRYIKMIRDGETIEKNIAETYVYDTPVLPVEIFVNNEDEVSDVEYFGVQGSLERLGYLDAEIRGEFEISKTLLAFNPNYANDEPETVIKDIKGGQGFIEETSYDAHASASKAIIQSNGAYLNLKQLCDSLEMDIREKMCMTDLPGVEKGTNKHTAEIIYKQEYAIDYLLNQQQAREAHYNQFLTKLSILLRTPVQEITLELNDITASKIDLLKAAITAESAKSTQVGMQKATEAKGDE